MRVLMAAIGLVGSLIAVGCGGGDFSSDPTFKPQQTASGR